MINSVYKPYSYSIWHFLFHVASPTTLQQDCSVYCPTHSPILSVFRSASPPLSLHPSHSLRHCPSFPLHSSLSSQSVQSIGATPTYYCNLIMWLGGWWRRRVDCGWVSEKIRPLSRHGLIHHPCLRDPTWRWLLPHTQKCLHSYFSTRQESALGKEHLIGEMDSIPKLR